MLYDDTILAEYREVLPRDKFGFAESDVHMVLDYIEAEGLRVTPRTFKITVPDKDDLPFLEVAMSGKADALVTGNKKHFSTISSKTLKIVSPDEFLQLFRKRKEE